MIYLKQIEEIQNGIKKVLSSGEYTNVILKNETILVTNDGLSHIIDTISDVEDDATSIYELCITASNSNNIYLGTKRTLIVAREGGTTLIKLINTDVHKSGGGLTPNSVLILASIMDGTININVTGIAATTIGWKCKYEKIL